MKAREHEMGTTALLSTLDDHNSFLLGRMGLGLGGGGGGG
jgi:hypothetical protein